MEQAIRLVPTLPPWVKEYIPTSWHTCWYGNEKKQLCSHLKGRKQLLIGLNSIIWLQSLANISAVTLASHYYYYYCYSFKCCCVLGISMIILIVYYLLLAIPPFPIICFSDFGLLSSVQQQILADECACHIIGTKIKPKQEPPPTPWKPRIWIADHPEDNTQLHQPWTCCI